MKIKSLRQFYAQNLAAALVAAVLLAALPVRGQTFTVNFSSASSPNCIKNKFGVYQTPFLGTGSYPPLTSMAPFLADAGVHDLRYEIGWGKPDTFAYGQIGGTETSPTIDFTQLDPFVHMLQTNGVAPLFATGYDPLPLETCNQWVCWQAPPDDYTSWQWITQQFANHYSSSLGLKGVCWEIWNEPDISSGGSKIFFTGDQTDYGNIYASAVAGINAGASDALVGGPAIAYDTSYYTQAGLANQPMNFASIHGYANAPGQISDMEGALGSRNVPIYMTEYASYTTFSATTANSTYPAAAAFFEDAKMFLTYANVGKIYWAQWIDDDVGMITYSLHKKALYNAYKIYQTMLPVNRVTVSPDNSSGIDTMAANGSDTAAIVAWNNNTSSATVTINLSSLPGGSGTLQLYRIDSQDASYIDDPNSENLAVNGQWTYTGGTSSWNGTIPGQGLILLLATTVPAAPATPTGLTATAGAGQVQLSWNPSAGAADYNLYRALSSGGPYTKIVSETGTNYTDSGLANGTTYYYAVAATNSTGVSANSTPVNATPSLAAALMVWFKADAISGVNSGSALQTWPDSSGNAHNATQATVSQQPTYVTGAMNGLPVVRFNAANSDYLSFNRVVQDDFTIICVYQSSQGIGTGTAFYQGAGLVNGEVAGVMNDFGTSLNANGQILAGTGNPDTTVASGNGFNTGQPHVFTFKRTEAAGALALYVDGTAAGTATGGTQSLTAPGQLVLGAQQTLLNYLTGDIAEVMIYNTPLADADRQNEENALRAKYAINVATLPAAPATPTGLTATAGNGQVALAWNPSTNATDYNLERSLARNGSYSVIASVAGTNYTDTLVTNGTTYYYVVAATNSVGGSTNSASVSATPSQPALLALQWATQPAGGPAGGTLAEADVKAWDASGADSNVMVAIYLTNSAGATLGGTLAQTTDAGGLAHFTGLSINQAGTWQLAASSGSLATNSSAFDITAGAATQLIWSTQPGGATNGLVFARQPVLWTADQFGNPTTAGLPATLDVTVTLSSGAGPLAGMTTGNIGTAGGNGTLTFANLQINAAGGGNELTAAASGGALASATASLKNRYSFNGAPGTTTVVDSAGSQNGQLLFYNNSAPYTNGTSDGSTFNGNGTLTLAGGNGYVALPTNGLVHALPSGAVTFEAWVQELSTQNSQALFDFGMAQGDAVNQKGVEQADIEFCPFDPNGPNGYPRGEAVSAGRTTVTAVDGTLAAQISTSAPVYYAIIYDPQTSHVFSYYTNGALAFAATGVSTPLLSAIDDRDAWLGQRIWTGAPTTNPNLDGIYDEFRIWDGTLSASDVATHYAAGPNHGALSSAVSQAFTVYPANSSTPGTMALLAFQNGAVTLSLTGAAGEPYHLETTTNLAAPVTWTSLAGSATNAPPGGAWQFTDHPSTSISHFYRLSSP